MSAIRRLALFILLLLAPLPARAVDIQSVTSPGGITAWLIEDHSNPLISLAFGFKGGASGDPAGKEGLATFISGMLDEGAGGIPSADFQKRLADHGIEFGFDASLDSFTGSLRFLTDDRDLSFELLGLALTAPRFDEEPVQRMRGQFISSAAQDERDPEAIAGRALNGIMFAGHPYSRRSSGTPQSLAAITVDDLRGFVAANFLRDRLNVAVVGDVTPEQLKPLLDKAFAALPEKGPPIAIPEAKVDDQGGLAAIERDIPQTILLFGAPGIKREDPDFFAAYLVNYTLGGGGFSSRLMHEVREKRGLAYGIDTDLVTLDHAGAIMGSAQTVAAQASQVIDLTRAEWAKMQQEGPTQAEIDAAKTYLLGYYAQNFTTTRSAARTLLGIQMEGLPIDYPTRREQEISAVTLEHAKAAAKRIFDPAKMVVVAVGQKDGLKPTRDAP
ncbi:M16 family metallopeptidase [Dongia sp.]|uniref:M16 family metallopeptidase n=1 Tax=Dongia sp. TaxID=1977262 RepID=UPI0037535EC0